VVQNASEDWQVFICCKVSDSDDNYTRDWYLAKELYDLLVENSIKVFMSSFSIERLGESDYKEVIDNALDKTQVLIVVGTSKENINSKWVKYEWNSFYNEILSGRKEKGQILTFTDELTNAELPFALRQRQSYKTSQKASLLAFIKSIIESSDSQNLALIEEHEEKTEKAEDEPRLEVSKKSTETTTDMIQQDQRDSSADKFVEEIQEETEKKKAEETEDTAGSEKKQEEQSQILQKDEKTSEHYLESPSQEPPSDVFLSPSLSVPISRATEGMVLVEKGSFMMGDEVEDLEIYCKPIHEVILTNSFLISKFQMTFEEYDLFCNETGRSKPKDEGWGRGQRPVINVSWNDAIAYCNWLSEKEKLPKAYDSEGNLLDKNGNITTDPSKVFGYRLPTEAEWEYAARGGNKSKGYKYSGSDNVDEIAWYDSNSRDRTQEVGKKAPNELVIYDMSGNVWEWCSDWYGLYLISVQTNPYNNSGSSRVTRGGSWSDLASNARVAYRNGEIPTGSYNYLGFRICRTVFEERNEIQEISIEDINGTSKNRIEENTIAKKSTEETIGEKTDNHVNETLSEEQELQILHEGEKADHHEKPVKKRRIAIPLFIFFTVLVSIAIAVMSLQKHPPNSSPKKNSNPEITLTSPINGSTGIEPNSITIKWTGKDSDGDEISYRVYFGETSSPTYVATTKQSEYTITSKDWGKKYYWRVEASDNYGGTTTSPVYSFTTKENKAPIIQSNPSPSDKATNQPTTITLSWDCSDPDGDTVTYDVYFDINTNPTKKMISTNQSGKSLNITSLSLSYGTTYYWRVVAKDSKEAITEGPVWSFTTQRVPTTTPYTPSSIVPQMVLVEKGSFTMGDTWGDGESDEKPTHKVTFTYDFYMGKYEVTFDEYDAFCEATGRNKPKDEDWGRGIRPVINVSWNDAIAYCNWLSEKEKLPKAYDNSGNLLDKDGRITTDPSRVVGYRLPTEAEWEYAARGGNKNKVYKYSGSDTVNDVAWYWDNSGRKTQEVGKKVPNELVIYDMSGNVWEWCSDWYGGYSGSAQTNPYNNSGSGRVLRGGSWYDNAAFVRVAFRNDRLPAYTNFRMGFRITRTVP